MSETTYWQHWRAPVGWRDRFGKFLIADDLVRGKPELALFVLEKVAIVRAEQMFHMRAIEYVGLCEAFDVLSEGECVPLYSAVVTQPENGVWALEWRRVEDARYVPPSLGLAEVLIGCYGGQKTLSQPQDAPKDLPNWIGSAGNVTVPGGAAAPAPSGRAVADAIDRAAKGERLPRGFDE